MSDDFYIDPAAVREFGAVAERAGAEASGIHSTIADGADLVRNSATSMVLSNLDSVSLIAGLNLQTWSADNGSKRDWAVQPRNRI